MTDVVRSSAAEGRGAVPFGVVVIAVLITVNAVLGIAAMFGYDIGPTGAGSALVISLFGDAARFLSIIQIVAIVGALGLLRGSRSAWFLVMLLTGLALAFQLIYWWDGEPQYLRMGIWVFVALYLNQRDVRAIYEGDRRPTEAIALEDAARGPRDE